jgi:hypothetical protein
MESTKREQDALCAIASPPSPYLCWLATNVNICNGQRSSEIFCDKCTTADTGTFTLDACSTANPEQESGKSTYGLGLQEILVILPEDMCRSRTNGFKIPGFSDERVDPDRRVTRCSFFLCEPVLFQSDPNPHSTAPIKTDEPDRPPTPFQLKPGHGSICNSLPRFHAARSSYGGAQHRQTSRSILFELDHHYDHV